jgi:hypothetical protein
MAVGCLAFSDYVFSKVDNCPLCCGCESDQCFLLLIEVPAASATCFHFATSREPH